MQSYDLPAAVPVAFGLGRLNDLGKLAAEWLGPEQRLLLVADPFAVSSGEQKASCLERPVNGVRPPKD